MNADGEVDIASWSVVGPFTLPPAPSEKELRRVGFKTDLLQEALAVSEESVDLQSWARLAEGAQRRGLRNVVSRSKDSVVDLGHVDREVKKGAYYLATTLEVDRPTDLALLVGASDRVKIWINGELVLGAPNDRKAMRHRDAELVSLPRGRSFVLAKVTCVLGEWALSARLASLGRAREIGKRERRHWAFLESHLVEHVEHLRVAPIHANSGATLTVQPLDGATPAERLAAEFGVRSVKISSGSFEAMASVLVGLPDSAAERLREEIRAIGGRVAGEDLEMIGERVPYLLDPERRAPKDRYWQMKLVDLLAQGSELIVRARSGESANAPSNTSGLRIRTYRSRVDAARQEYMMSWPSGREGAQPLVLVIPPESNPIRPFYQSIRVADAEQVNMLASLAEQRGLAIAWLNLRGNAYASPLATTDLEDALGAIDTHYDVDWSRVYLLGHCGGGREALTFSGLAPDRFAGLGLVGPITQRDRLIGNKTEWQLASAPAQGPKTVEQLTETAGRDAVRKLSPDALIPALVNLPMFIDHEPHEENYDAVSGFVSVLRTAGGRVELTRGPQTTELYVRYGRALTFFASLPQQRPHGTRPLRPPTFPPEQLGVWSVFTDRVRIVRASDEQCSGDLVRALKSTWRASFFSNLSEDPDRLSEVRKSKTAIGRENHPFQGDRGAAYADVGVGANELEIGRKQKGGG